MPIRLDELKKLESSSVPRESERNEEELLELIVKVRKPNYVPPNVTPRAQIDPQIFTCQVPAKRLVDLERDPGVVSVAVSKKLRIID